MRIKDRTPNFIDYVVGIPLVIVLYVIASICYLVQHLYNLCRGKGWTGMSL